VTSPDRVGDVATDPTLRYRLGGRKTWMVWAAATSVYILAVFHRTSLGVAGLIAAERFHITSAQLATFTMVQLFVYAAMQIPVGAILDRVGAKKLLITGVVLMTAGQFAFAFANTFGAGVAARVFVGMGDAMIFISLMQLVALWFPPARTAMVTQRPVSWGRSAQSPQRRPCLQHCTTWAGHGRSPRRQVLASFSGSC